MQPSVNPEHLLITKLDDTGCEIFSWQGVLLQGTPTSRLVEATFGLASLRVDRTTFEAGDMFLESYFSNRWFNIFEVHAQRTTTIKGWYCNLSFPATFSDRAIRWRDLALDLMVYPDGSHSVLDLDEFEALQLDAGIRARCSETLQELIAGIHPQAVPVFSPQRWLQESEQRLG